MQKNKSVAFFTPFPQIIGGGERYIFTLADFFSKQGFIVDILSPFGYDLKEIKKNFDLELKNCRFKKTSARIFFIPPFKKTYDYFFCLSNHIFPPVFGQGRYNTLIIQFPFPFNSKKLGDKIQKYLLISKLNSYQNILCYSKYVKKWIKIKLPKEKKNISINIINPPISIIRFLPKVNKKNIILSVGRFFANGHNKQHFQLIKTFKLLVNRGLLKGWELHLAGFVSEAMADKAYYQKVLDLTKDYPIFVHSNASPQKINKLYLSSKIFWHGTGYLNNENITPEKSEHFGIAVVEAMAAGVVPVVLNSGGLSEIVANKRDGLLWKNIDELFESTKLLSQNNEKLMYLSKNAKQSAKKFDVKYFEKSIQDLYNI